MAELGFTAGSYSSLDEVPDLAPNNFGLLRAQILQTFPVIREIQQILISEVASSLLVVKLAIAVKMTGN